MNRFIYIYIYIYIHTDKHTYIYIYIYIYYKHIYIYTACHFMCPSVELQQSHCRDNQECTSIHIYTNVSVKRR